MAVGNTITDSLADSIPTMIASARIVREFAGVMPNLVDRQRLDENTGTVWNEVSMAKLSAQAVTESTELDNPQQMSDTPVDHADCDRCSHRYHGPRGNANQRKRLCPDGFTGAKRYRTKERPGRPHGHRRCNNLAGFFQRGS